MSFSITLSNVLLMLMYMLPGYALHKTHHAKAEHLSTLSAILIYILGPCMITNAFIDMDYTGRKIYYLGMLLVASLVVQILFVLIMYLVLRKKFQISKYRILTIGSVLGNVGFFGMPLVKALYPTSPEVACYSSIFVVSMNLIVFTLGVYCLTMDKKYMTPKAALLNPTTIAFFFVLILVATGVKNHIPVIVHDSVSLLGRMTTPVCMFILGIRLATIKPSVLFSNPFIYLICLCKQLVFPLFVYGITLWINLPITFRASLVVLAGTPCASIILNLAEIHHSEEKLAANVLLVSTLSCILTLPLLTFLF